MYDKVVLEFSKYYLKRKKYWFLTHKRQKNQSVENYITKQKIKAVNCDYGVPQKLVIGDQLVLNVTNQ